jgi:hypothetical protein
MDQRPRDDLPPTRDDPLTDDLGSPRARTTWDRATRTEEGGWNMLPLLIVAALIAIGGWMLFASDRAETPGPRTTETAPATRGPATPGPNINTAPQNTAPPATTTPATKP